MKRMRIIKRVSLIFLFAFVFAELLLRVIQVPSLQYFWNQKRFHAYHPVYNVALEPSVSVYLKHNQGLWEGRFSTNSFGHRGSPEPDPEGKNLTCLGDSIVMGFGVSDDETFCARLDGVVYKNESLRAINLGVDAFGSRGSAERLLEAVEKFQFRTALFFLSPNDFSVPDTLAEQGVLPDDILDEYRLEDEAYKNTFRIQFQLTRWSYVLMASRLAMEQLKIKSSMAEAEFFQEISDTGLFSGPDFAKFGRYVKGSFYRGAPPCDEKSISAESTLPACASDPLPSDCEDLPPKPEELEELPDATKRSYDRMIESAKKKGFDLQVVMLPQQIEVLRCGAAGKHHRFFNYAIRAASYFKERGVSVLDFRSQMNRLCSGEKKGIPPSSLIIPGDGHFTKSGNRWISDGLKQKLEAIPFGKEKPGVENAL